MTRRSYSGPWATDQLVVAAQRGDSESIAELLSGARPHVQRYAHALCASPQDAEDAAQEALIVLYRKIGSLRATAAMTSWMFRIVRNECQRLSRRRFRDELPSWDDAGLESSESAEIAVLRQLEAERVASVIARLPEVQRQVLVMRDVQGLPGRAVANALGLSLAAMKSQLHRARAAVQSGLADDPNGITAVLLS